MKMKRNVNEEINKIKKVMGLLTEEMKKIANPKIVNHSDSNYVFIGKDETNDNEHYLVLNVYLVANNKNKKYSYTYGFSVYNTKLELFSNLLYTRSEVSKYLSKDIKPIIMPLIIDMTKELVNRIKPNTIERETMEKIPDQYMDRYNQITDLLVNELGYKLDTYTKSSDNEHYWKFIRRDATIVEFNEEQLINFKPSKVEERVIILNKRIRERFTPEIKKQLLEMLKNK